MDDVVWVRVGDHRVRVDQIASWRDAHYNADNHVVYVTLVSGKEVQGEMSYRSEEWKKFQEALVGC